VYGRPYLAVNEAGGLRPHGAWAKRAGRWFIAVDLAPTSFRVTYSEDLPSLDCRSTWSLTAVT
jgi:hypothetical protein